MGLISHVLCFKFNINFLLHQLKEGNTEFLSLKGKLMSHLLHSLQRKISSE